MIHTSCAAPARSPLPMARPRRVDGATLRRDRREEVAGGVDAPLSRLRSACEACREAPKWAYDRIPAASVRKRRRARGARKQAPLRSQSVAPNYRKSEHPLAKWRRCPPGPVRVEARMQPWSAGQVRFSPRWAARSPRAHRAVSWSSSAGGAVGSRPARARGDLGQRMSRPWQPPATLSMTSPRNTPSRSTSSRHARVKLRGGRRRGGVKSERGAGRWRWHTRRRARPLPPRTARHGPGAHSARRTRAGPSTRRHRASGLPRPSPPTRTS